MLLYLSCLDLRIEAVAINKSKSLSLLAYMHSRYYTKAYNELWGQSPGLKSENTASKFEEPSSLQPISTAHGTNPRPTALVKMWLPQS